MGISEEAMKWLEKRERQLPKIRLDYDPRRNLSVIHEMAHSGFSSIYVLRGQLQAIGNKATPHIDGSRSRC
jgi:hypothetical protein